MKELKFEISDGETDLYDLHLDGMVCAMHLTLDEVLAYIAAKEEANED